MQLSILFQQSSHNFSRVRFKKIRLCSASHHCSLLLQGTSLVLDKQMSFDENSAQLYQYYHIRGETGTTRVKYSLVEVCKTGPIDNLSAIWTCYTRSWYLKKNKMILMIVSGRVMIIVALWKWLFRPYFMFLHS